MWTFLANPIQETVRTNVIQHKILDNTYLHWFFCSKVESYHNAYEHDWHFENLQNSNVKFVEKKLLERKILKCIWKMSIKDFEKYKYDKCGKNFTHNIGLLGHITAVNERKESIVINVAKILHYDCDSCGKSST